MIEKDSELHEELGADVDSDSVQHSPNTVDLSWQDFAECSSADTDLFFPDQGASTKAAKAICKACIVREDCLEHALMHEKHGIWGGTSERERRKIRKARALRAAQYVTSVTIEA